MKIKKSILLLAAGHGLNDLIAGYFLGCIVQGTADILQASMGLIIYNVLAFGGQYPAALLIERSSSPKKFLFLSYGLNVAAVMLFPFKIQLSIVLAGVASAFYHVAGGTICAKENKAADIGLFAAPGVGGLIAGGYFAFQKTDITIWLLVAAGLFLLLLIKLSVETKKTTLLQQSDRKGRSFTLDQHDVIMIILLTIISLRSVIWNVFQLIHENNYYWLIAIAASAFVGKIAGGWIADKIGWRLYMITSLVIATPLITLFKKEMVLFCIGIGLLQSGIPATTALLIRPLKGNIERAIGLSFGSAIILGALIFYTPARAFLFSGYSILIVAAVMLLLMYIFSRKADQYYPSPGT